MKAALVIALVLLAVVGSGCDAVFGELHTGVIAGQYNYFNAISDDSGAHAGGTTRIMVCCPTYFDFNVTCLNVVHNRATIGVAWAPVAGHQPPSTGELWYVEDNPGKDTDKLHKETVPAPPTTCPSPPTTITNDDVTTDDIHVIDDFHN